MDLMKDNIVYMVAKHIAEEDSIGEQYGYCSHYTEEMFMDLNNA